MHAREALQRDLMPEIDVTEGQHTRRPEVVLLVNGPPAPICIDDSLAVRMQGLPAGPVLLVDDMVDSRWTLTVSAWPLRSHGSGEVFPLALALTGPGE